MTVVLTVFSWGKESQSVWDFCSSLSEAVAALINIILKMNYSRLGLETSVGNDWLSDLGSSRKCCGDLSVVNAGQFIRLGTRVSVCFGVIRPADRDIRRAIFRMF